MPADHADELATALQTAARAPEGLTSKFSVQTTANGAPADTMVRVLRSDDKTVIAAGRTYVSPTTNPRVLPVPPGTYDVEVQAVSLRGATTKRFAAIPISAKETVTRSVDFSTGHLSVKVTRNGELSDATVNVFVAGTDERVAGGRTYRGDATNPRNFELIEATTVSRSASGRIAWS